MARGCVQINKVGRSIAVKMEAFNLGSNNRIKVKDVPSLCGFDNVCYFIRVFREKYDVTPADFREENHSLGNMCVASSLKTQLFGRREHTTVWSFEQTI